MVLVVVFCINNDKGDAQNIHSKGDYNLQQKENGILRYDVGVDANNFCPVSIEYIKGDR